LSEHIDRYGLNFTGLFLVTGNAASGVLRSLCDHGYSVPDDVSILGFQNAEYCAFLSPPLTVVGGNGAGTARLRATAIDRYLADPASGLIAVPYRAVLIDGKSMKDIRKPFTTGE
ncbi:substrate-binding domain-containing protein, partial [Victivallis vadensis]